MSRATAFAVLVPAVSQQLFTYSGSSINCRVTAAARWRRGRVRVAMTSGAAIPLVEATTTATTEFDVDAAINTSTAAAAAAECVIDELGTVAKNADIPLLAGVGDNVGDTLHDAESPVVVAEDSAKASAMGVNAAKSATSTTGTKAVDTSTALRISVYYSEKFLLHRAPPGSEHPECPERLMVCMKALKADAELSGMVDITPPRDVQVDSKWGKEVRTAVERVHVHEEYLERLENISKSGGALGCDTYVAPGSFDIAMLAVGAWLQATQYALDSGYPAVALARPPGHHATPAAGMGFCLLSNAAIAARYALTMDQVRRVAIVDFDVHHGNGTEACVRMESRIRFASSHQYPLYPMSGEEREDGGASGEFDNILNINLSEGAGFDEYMPRFKADIVPHILQDGVPDVVIVSAGYDALEDDPLGGLSFEPRDYARFIATLVEAVGHTKFVIGLEGGYSLGEEGISAAFCETLRGFFT